MDSEKIGFPRDVADALAFLFLLKQDKEYQTPSDLCAQFSAARKEITQNMK